MDACYCDCEQPEFWTQNVRRARKSHRCCECGSDIKPGEQYEAYSGKWDGYVTSYSTCERCLAFRQWYAANRPCFCWCFTEMFDAVRDDVEDQGHVMLKEAPGFLFEVGRRYVKIRNRARADRAMRKVA